MRESYEFRVHDEVSAGVLAEDEGEKIGYGVRRIFVDPDDEMFERLRNAYWKRRSIGKAFHSSWTVRRRYSKKELATASLFTMYVKPMFEPAGEECGTAYDEAAACPHCGSGAEQTTPLRILASKIPHNKDFARTIADEIVVSRKAADVFRNCRISGVNFDPVFTGSRATTPSENWFQFRVTTSEADMVLPTRLGINPFDNDREQEFVCAKGDLAGLNLLSEISIRSKSRGSLDVISTRQFTGRRAGLLRPQRSILVSPRVRDIVLTEELRGLDFEVAHVV